MKMNILPRLLFLFQMIPYKVHPGFFTVLQSIICKYAWNRKRPRIARNLLIKPKREGGLTLPDFKCYFLAIILNRLSDWKYQESKLWVQLELDLSGVDLFPLMWIPSKFRKLSLSTSPLTKSSFAMWDSLCKMHKRLHNSPLMQLTGHDYFPPGNPDPKFNGWISMAPILLHQMRTS